MKKNILFLSIALLCLVSCYKDESTYPEGRIHDVVLATSGQDDDASTIRVGYLEPLDLSPELSVDGDALDPERYSYLWQINEDVKESDFYELSRERDLHVTLENIISLVPYRLMLTVTDNVEGVDFVFSWDVYIQSAFLDGLLVSDTQDGVSSDLTLVLNDKLTTNYEGKPEKRFSNIIKSATGSHYPSKLTGLFPATMGYSFSVTNFVLAIDDNGAPVRFNCIDYSISEGRSVLLYQHEGQRATKFLSASTNSASQGAWLMLTNMGFYHNQCMNSNTFATPYAQVRTSPRNGVVASRSYVSGGICATAWIDEDSGKLINLDQTFNGVTEVALDNSGSSSPAFDATTLATQSVIGGGFTYNEDTPAFLLKDSSDQYAIYTESIRVEEQGEYDDDWNYTVTVPAIPYTPKARIVLPSSMNSKLNSAVDVEFCTMQPILYVATENEVSAVMFGNGTAEDGGVKFTPDNGEKITDIQIYQQGAHKVDSGYLLDGYRPAVPWNNSALIVTTQKGDAEGAVYVVPMTQVGTGNLDKTQALKYDGFGRILSVTTTNY